MRYFLIALIASLASSCVNMKAVGRFEKYNEVFIGSVDWNMVIGGSKFNLTGVNSNITCEGTTDYPDDIPMTAESLLRCIGQKGDGRTTCSDGRKYSLRYTLTQSCGIGYGEGISNDGVKMKFVFGLSESEAIAAVEKAMRDVSNLPLLSSKTAEDNCKNMELEEGSEEFKKCVLDLSN
jgi:hypothetical protein